MSAGSPRVFTIPAATPFVPTLVRALIDGALGFAPARDPRALASATLDLPPAIDGLERRLLLAELVTRWAQSPALRGEGHAPLVVTGPAAALSLADDLARLMDDLTTRQVPWEQLDQ